MSDYLLNFQNFVYNKFSELNRSDLIIIISIFILLIVIIIFLATNISYRNTFFELFTVDEYSVQTEEQFKELLRKPFTIIVIHSPNCPHCIEFLKENGPFKNFLDHLKSKNMNNTSISIVSNPQLISYIESKITTRIQGYPTILVTKNRSSEIIKDMELQRYINDTTSNKMFNDFFEFTNQ